MQQYDLPQLASIIKEGITGKELTQSYTLGDYLALHAANDPTFCMNAAGLLAEAIAEAGFEKVETIKTPRLKRIHGDITYTAYNLFVEFYGIELELEGLVNFLKAAAQGGQYARMALWFFGPPASGKTTLTEQLIRGLLRRTQPFLAIEGCPMNEHPYLLVPQHIREQVGLPADGAPCTVCSQKLLERQGRWWEIEVTQRRHSEFGRCGIGRMTPGGRDDLSTLIGTTEPVNGEKSLAAGMRFNGTAHFSNRGILEIAEMVKDPSETLVQFLKAATEERKIQLPDRSGFVPLDAVIIIHSNIAEWEAFKSKYQKSGILSRIYPIQLRYNLRSTEAVSILEKLLRRNRVSYVQIPGVFETVGKFGIGTRISAKISNKELDDAQLDERTGIYNGDVVMSGCTLITTTARKLQEQAPLEGTSGIPDRFIVGAIEETLLGDSTLYWWHLEEALRARIQRDEFFTPEQKTFYLKRLKMANTAYRSRLRRDIEQACTGDFDAEAERLFVQYTACVERNIMPPSATSTTNQKEMRAQREADEAFLKSVEEQIAVIGPSALDFRKNVPGKLNPLQRKGITVSRSTLPELGEAVERMLRNRVHIEALLALEPNPNDEKSRQKRQGIRSALIGAGYPEECLDEILRYAHQQKLFGP